MNKLIPFFMFLVIVFGLGLWIGYAVGVNETQEEAVANRCGHYEWLLRMDARKSREFAWGAWKTSERSEL